MHLTKVSNPAGSTHRDYATFKVSVSNKNIYSSLRDRSFIASGGGKGAIF